MVQGVNKEYIFKKEKYIENYLYFIQEYSKNYDFTIISYCIMNNHAHFLVFVQDVSEFGKFMQKVNLRFANMYNKEEKRCGVLFRNRYQSESISDIRYLINCIKYIHDNPVKAKMVENCEDYKYSSYKDYINNKGATKSKILKEIFGENCDFRTLFKHTNSKIFMDIDKPTEYEIKEYILSGIDEFKKTNKIDLVQILSNRKILKELIFYLNEKCKIKYKDIQNFFELSRTTLFRLRCDEVTF